MHEFCIIRINLILILVIALWLILAFDTWDLQKRRVQQTRSPCALSILMDPRRELRHLCKADRVTAETHGHTPSPCSRYSKHKNACSENPPSAFHLVSCVCRGMLLTIPLTGLIQLWCTYFGTRVTNGSFCYSVFLASLKETHLLDLINRSWCFELNVRPLTSTHMTLLKCPILL